MSVRCGLGFHRWSAYQHRLGVQVLGVQAPAWDFDQHCLRCGKHRTQRYWLPVQQPSPRPSFEPHPDFSGTDG